MTQETGPLNLEREINNLGKEQLRDLISWGQTRQAERGTAAPATPLTEPQEAGRESSPELDHSERAFMEKKGVIEEDAAGERTPEPDETQQARIDLQADLDNIKNQGGITGWVMAVYRQVKENYDQANPGQKLREQPDSEMMKKLMNNRIEVLSEHMANAQIAPPGNDPSSPWAELARHVPREDMARIEFAVFCLMRERRAEGWQDFFDDEENIRQFEPRIAALLDPENRDKYDTLLQLRAENAALEQKPGVDEESIDRFISQNPALARDLFAKGGPEVTNAFEARQRFRNRFLRAVTLEAGVAPNQLQELAEIEKAAGEARQKYESSPGMENFTTKLAAAVAYYQLANEIRGKRAAFLQKLASDARLKFNAEGFLERDINP